MDLTDKHVSCNVCGDPIDATDNIQVWVFEYNLDKYWLNNCLKSQWASKPIKNESRIILMLEYNTLIFKIYLNADKGPWFQ